jgi:hypothetical protein
MSIEESVASIYTEFIGQVVTVIAGQMALFFGIRASVNNTVT